MLAISRTQPRLKLCPGQGPSVYKIHNTPGFSQRRISSLIVRASSEDEELEKRLEKLRKFKGATPYGQGAKSDKKNEKDYVEAPKKSAAPSKPQYDYSSETVYYEGPPHRGDLALNVALGTTLVWLPLTFASLGRCSFVNYRFTDRRISVKTDAPWKKEQLDAAYQEIKRVQTVGRAFGLWGDMVVELKDGSKFEMRSLDRYKELEKYINDKRTELSGNSGQLTQQELLDGPIPAKGKRGFS